MIHHQTARQAGFVPCHVCTVLVPISHTARGVPAARCPRCGAPLHMRKPRSVTRAWALLLAAAIFYVPANLLPIMTVVRFGQGEPDTILSGVQHLLESGMWPLALLIFFASIIVPISKLSLLGFLLLSVQHRTHRLRRGRTALYRWMELFGHWSMVDVFLIAILVALVQMDSLTRIEPEEGASFFGAVVVLTMLASKSFDPRLIWDNGVPFSSPTDRPSPVRSP